MYSILLALIYLAFISLGLPDALLGSAWPVMYPMFNVPISLAGLITMVISVGTIISSLNTSRLIRKFGTGMITSISVMLTALALFGFSISDSFWMLVVWSIPYGLGAGAVDAALNSFVAEHYSSRHMSWLHAFWGVGASAGPYIMSYALISRNSWEYGYSSVGIIQIGLTFLLLMSLPIWKKQSELSAQKKIGHHHLKISEALKIKGVKHILIAFFAYCALEATTGLWASTYLVIHKGIQAEIAARWASLFYLGITGGRFLSGFISERFGNRNMIRIGLILIAIGLIVILIPSEIEIITLLGLIVTGLGCAPIYPSIIHETPTNFGAQNAQSIIGIQMASAYVGTTLMPPLFGVLGDYVSISLYPIYLLILLFVIWNMTEKLNKIVTQNAN